MTSPDFARLFALYIDWPLRLKKEIPFLEGILGKAGARVVLDVGAGEGKHVLALAGHGFEASGCDIHEGLVGDARKAAESAGVKAHFFVSCMTRLSGTATRACDAVLCLGNTAAMMPDAAAFEAAIASMAGALGPGGLLIAHAVNCRALRIGGKRFGPPRLLDDGRIVLKFFDLDPGLTRVNVAVLAPSGPGRMSLETASHPFLELTETDFRNAFEHAGLKPAETFGGPDSSPFIPDKSPELYAVAEKS